MAFILIAIAMAWLFLIRPRWLIWPSLIVAGQALYSHGGHAIQIWHRKHQISRLDAIVIAIALYGVAIACFDRWGTDSPQTNTNAVQLERK